MRLKSDRESACILSVKALKLLLGYFSSPIPHWYNSVFPRRKSNWQHYESFLVLWYCLWSIFRTKVKSCISEQKYSAEPKRTDYAAQHLGLNQISYIYICRCLYISHMYTDSPDKMVQLMIFSALQWCESYTHPAGKSFWILTLTLFLR